MNVSGLGHHLFSGGTAALKGVNTFIRNRTWTLVKSKVPLRKDNDCPAIDYLDVELATKGNHQTEAVFPARVILGYTIPTESALASRRLRSGAMQAVASLATVVRSFIS